MNNLRISTQKEGKTAPFTCIFSTTQRTHFSFTQRPAKPRHIEMAKNKEEYQEYQCKPCSGSIRIARDMLCRRLQHLFPLNKPMSSTAATDFCRFHWFLSHRYLHLLTPAPESLPSPCSTGTWDPHQQQVQASEATQMQDSSLDPYHCAHAQG